MGWALLCHLESGLHIWSLASLWRAFLIYHITPISLCIKWSTCIPLFLAMVKSCDNSNNRRWETWLEGFYLKWSFYIIIHLVQTNDEALVKFSVLLDLIKRRMGLG